MKTSDIHFNFDVTLLKVTGLLVPRNCQGYVFNPIKGKKLLVAVLEILTLTNNCYKKLG